MSEVAQKGEHVVRRAGRAQGLQQAGEWAGAHNREMRDHQELMARVARLEEVEVDGGQHLHVRDYEPARHSSRAHQEALHGRNLGSFHELPREEHHGEIDEANQLHFQS